MKRILFFSTLLLIGGGTVGKNYLIYSKVQQLHQQNQDRLQIDDLSWSWKDVQAKNIRIITKTDPHLTYQIQNVSLTHNWLSPLQIHLETATITGRNLKMTSLQGGFSYWSGAVSSTDLSLQNIGC